MDKLGKLRDSIDGIDEEIVRLMAIRMDVVRKIGAQKQQSNRAVEDRGREKIVLELWRENAEKYDVPADAAIGVAEILISTSKKEQEKM